MRKNLAPDLPATLRALMDRRGLTQTELASRSGLSDSSISHYLSGQHQPTPKALAALAEALDITPEDLRSGTLPKAPSGRITIKQAAKCMAVCEQFVRIGLQQGTLPFGVALKLPGSTKFTYYIRPEVFRDYVGRKRFDECFNT